MKRDLIRLLAGILTITGLFSCAGPGYAPSQAASASGGTDSSEMARSSGMAPQRHPAERSGLATGWGQEKISSVSDRSFVRASSQPAGTDAIYYNNPEGIEAMGGDLQRVAGMQSAAGGLVEWGMKGRMGFLAAYKESGYGRRLVAGERKETYTIVLRNRSRSTLEIVASVDGLDVMDGKRAAFSKRGYLVNPGATFEIKGFRTSYESVAAFKFSNVANSYANLRHGDTRNVGVIGIAVFTQKGSRPWATPPNEIRQRNSASPFATAP